MALPGHSPSHNFGGPGSPSRVLNGHSDAHLPPSIYAPTRSMLPPSPQHYQPRFQNASVPISSPSLPSLQETRLPPPPYKRPGSSMSISSMLGGDPERTAHDPYQNHSSRTPSRQASLNTTSVNYNNAMSPPQQPAHPIYSEYNYKPRSRTPDRMSAPFNVGITRQRSSSSGTTLQRPDPSIERHQRSASNTPIAGYNDRLLFQPFGQSTIGPNEQEERVRRTSLSGILQRPNSQPQSGMQISPPSESFKPQHSVMAPSSFDRTTQPESTKASCNTGLYDTRPPGLNGSQKKPVIKNPSPPMSLPPSLSPELKRPHLNGVHSRGLANILNGPPSQPAEAPSVAQKMARQDSAQSQGGSLFGDRNKIRAYSPFNTSFTSGTPTIDAQGRKGSDELSQHRAILGLAAENKRGRFSPMPQAVQGAQARTPVPDAGVKTEHGRVFSGIGSGIGTTPTPAPLSASPLKKDTGPMRLSEDNLKSFSRNTPGVKRSRKPKDDEGLADSDAVAADKPVNSRKRNKQHHNYKADLEEMATTVAAIQRKASPLAGVNSVPQSSISANGNHTNVHNYPHAVQHTTGHASVFRPKKVIKVSSVFSAAAKNTRRHLGNFVYRPHVSQTESSRSYKQKFDISITPNLVPSFANSDHVNCTYTIHVPRMWLQARERGLICTEQHLWGSGIYTDDSDPVAAAMHAGFLKTVPGEGIDTSLLSRIVHDQNPRIEFPQDLKVPDHPRDIEANKDLNILLVVLPVLEQYEGSARFGIRSRSWPDGSEKTQHDGVSFGILRIDFVNVGTEEMRVGRTGQGRRERLRMDLEARKRDLGLQHRRIEQAKQKQLQQIMNKKKLQTGSAHGNLAVPRSVPLGGMAGSRPGSSLGTNTRSVAPVAGPPA